MPQLSPIAQDGLWSSTLSSRVPTGSRVSTSSWSSKKRKTRPIDPRLTSEQPMTTRRIRAVSMSYWCFLSMIRRLCHDSKSQSVLARKFSLRTSQRTSTQPSIHYYLDRSLRNRPVSTLMSAPTRLSTPQTSNCTYSVRDRIPTSDQRPQPSAQSSILSLLRLDSRTNSWPWWSTMRNRN